MSILNAFKLKTFDLEALYQSWPDAPRFLGNPKKDLPLDDWLEQIRLGCVERKVPHECWHKVAQHYMGDKAKARLDELKAVVATIQGGKYRWNWKKFKIAMHNMSWEIDASRTEAIKVKQKGAGRWWITRKAKDDSSAIITTAIPTKNTKSTAATETATEIATSVSKRANRSNTLFSRVNPRPAALTRSRTTDTSTSCVTEVAQAPTWLLNACNALEYLTAEHPTTMTAISAILITIGSIPAIPAISAGAGGALLASGTAHAVGAIAVGVGSMLQSAQAVQHARAASRPAASI